LRILENGVSVAWNYKRFAPGTIPYVDAGTTDTSKNSADNERIHVRCCTAQGRADFKEKDASEKEDLEIVDSIKGGSKVHRISLAHKILRWQLTQGGWHR
jgi:hypothetical protein